MFSQKEKKKERSHASRFDSFTAIMCFTVVFLLFLSLPLSRSFDLSLSLSHSFISFVGERMDYASRDPRLIACTNVSKNKRRNCTINGCPVFCFFFFRFSKFLLKGMWRQWVIVTEPEINFISILSYWCLLYALKRSPKDGRNRPIGNLGSHGLHNFPSLSPFTFFSSLHVFS